MSENIFTPNEIEVFEETNALRRKIIKELCGEGQVPTDKDSLNALLKAAKDMDAQVSTTARIRSNNSNADKATDASSIIAGILMQMGNSTPTTTSNGNMTPIDAAVVDAEVFETTEELNPEYTPINIESFIDD